MAAPSVLEAGSLLKAGWQNVKPGDPGKPVHDVPDPAPQRPPEPDAADCCGEGCARCVYDVYDEAIERHEAALAAWRARHRQSDSCNFEQQVAAMWTAITREVSPALAACELSYIPRVPIDVSLARTQHHAYQQALLSLDCQLLCLPVEPALADSVFVEDVAIVLDEVAILTRPGAASRRPEVATVAEALRHYRPLHAIEAPATLDGGDVLRVGRTLYVGESARSNAAGIAQLRQLLAAHGYTVEGVTTRGCLHLKSAVTALAEDTLLLQPAWVDRHRFEGLRIIEIDPAEPHAANVLRVGDWLIMPASFPRTRQRLLEAGFKVIAVDVSELQKAEGAVTCCSLVFRVD
jgi:dimethylargininase